MKFYQSSDKRGGGNSYSSKHNILKNFLDGREGFDLGYIGNPFTRTNGRLGWVNVKTRIDRAVMNIQWHEILPRACIFHLPAMKSVHNPLLFNVDEERQQLPRPLRFMEDWTRDDGSKMIVTHAWKSFDGRNHNSQIMRKLNETTKALQKWNQEVFGFIQTRIKKLQQELDLIQQKELTEENLQIEVNIQLELDE